MGSGICKQETPLAFRECAGRMAPSQTRAVCGGGGESCSRPTPFSALSLCHPEPQTAPALFQKMVCHGEHTYLFAQAMMSVLAQEEQGGSAVRRIAQEVQRFAQEK